MKKKNYNQSNALGMYYKNVSEAFFPWKREESQMIHQFFNYNLELNVFEGVSCII